MINGIPRDAADDNYNSFDPYPPVSATDNRLGEVGDLDFLDPAGAFLLPVERVRRYVTPADINGTGRIVQYDGRHTTRGPDAGGDQWGRVEYYSYFRPPGLPGEVAPSGGTTPGAVVFPWTVIGTEAYPTTLVTNNPLAPSPPSNSNPLHGFESQRFPNLNYPGGGNSWNPQHAGGVPIDLYPNAKYSYLPGFLPTYDAKVNGNPNVKSDGLNEADEMNLYVPNAQLDAPFGYGDLEWLYRQQDVDGGSLTSRLAQLAPVSFSNPVDGLRRRRLFALDSWEMNNFAWTNDNPGGIGFPNNSRFNANANASFANLNVTAANITANPTYPWNVFSGGSVPTNPNLPAAPNPVGPWPVATPALAQRDKKINLNYPLPVSNDPNEAVRQKWISETYQTLKAILPPRAVDTAEELAQLSQFAINIIDFRDTDATMTHWRNPDVFLRPGTVGTPGTNPFPVLASVANPTTDIPLDQYGMEYNPVAINETMAYSFQGTSSRMNRFFIELVNTLTSPELGTTASPGLGTPANNASVLDLAGFQSNPNPPAPGTPLTTPWDGGCWDLIFANDDPLSRPDPVMGQLLPGGTYYGLLPLAMAPLGSIAPPTDPLLLQFADPVIFPLPQAPPQAAGTSASYFVGDNTIGATMPAPPSPPALANQNYYFMTIGNPPGGSGTEQNPFTPTYTLSTTQPFDPVNAGTMPGTVTVPPGVLPPPAVYQPAAHCLSGQDPIRGEPDSRHRPVLLGLPPPAGQSVCRRFGRQPHDRGRRDAVPVHRGIGDRIWNYEHRHDRQQHFLVPAASAVPGRTRGAHGHLDHHSGSTLRLQRADRRSAEHQRQRLGPERERPDHRACTQQRLLPHPRHAQ